MKSVVKFTVLLSKTHCFPLSFTNCNFASSIFFFLTQLKSQKDILQCFSSAIFMMKPSMLAIWAIVCVWICDSYLTRQLGSQARLCEKGSKNRGLAWQTRHFFHCRVFLKKQSLACQIHILRKFWSSVSWPFYYWVSPSLVSNTAITDSAISLKPKQVRETLDSELHKMTFKLLMKTKKSEGFMRGRPAL